MANLGRKFKKKQRKGASTTPSKTPTRSAIKKAGDTRQASSSSKRKEGKSHGRYYQKAYEYSWTTKSRSDFFLLLLVVVSILRIVRVHHD